MAIGATIYGSYHSPLRLSGNAGRMILPASMMSNWVTVNSAPTTADATPVIDPFAITRAAVIPLAVNGNGTSVLFRMKYTKATPPTVDPVVQVFGLDANNIPMKLVDADGTHLLTCVEAATTDATDGTSSYTAHHSLDCAGSVLLYFTIGTLSSGGSADEVIQAKII